MAKPCTSAGRNGEAARDVGTMWLMTRYGCTARCALVSGSEEWELRVLIDGELLLSSRSTATKDLFATAEEWRARMIDRGWTKVTPSYASGTRVQSASEPFA